MGIGPFISLLTREAFPVVSVLDNHSFTKEVPQVISRVLTKIYYLTNCVTIKDIGEFGVVYSALTLDDSYIVQVGKTDSSEQYVLWNMVSFHLLGKGIVCKELFTSVEESSSKIEIDCINYTSIGSLVSLPWVPQGIGKKLVKG